MVNDDDDGSTMRSPVVDAEGRYDDDDGGEEMSGVSSRERDASPFGGQRDCGSASCNIQVPPIDFVFPIQLETCRRAPPSAEGSEYLAAVEL